MLGENKCSARKCTVAESKNLSFYSSIFCFDHCGLCHLYFPAFILGQDLSDFTNLATLRLEIYFYSLQYRIWNLN